jgi:hypothetical protein
MINPYRNSDISIMTKYNFFHNEYIQKLPYQKGFVYALYLYQRYGNEFINKFKTIINRIHKGAIYDMDNYKRTLGDKNFDKYIIKGDTIRLKYKKTKKINQLKLDFDLDYAIKNNIIKDLDDESKSYKKGLRNGKIEELRINYKERNMEIIQKGKTIKIKNNNGKSIDVPTI